MGKWALGFLIALLSCVPIFLIRFSNPGMLQDTDTAVLLSVVRKEQNPLSWFTGDWPLGNHFYRPISTLAFELDNALYGTNAAGYGLTNCLICIACVLLLYWFLRELTDRLEIALPAALIFAMWHFGAPGYLPQVVWWAGIASLGLILLPGRNWRAVLVFSLVTVFLSSEIGGFFPLSNQMLGWLPSRTASVMTLFGLLSLAAYCRYERISAARIDPPEPGPLDPPATKGTSVRLHMPRAAWAWAILSILGLVLALGSYEQAVVLPGLLVGSALCLRLQGFRPRWGWQAAIWGILLSYLALRAAIVPSDVSGYQAQQFRSGPGVWFSLLGYLFPAAPGVWQSFLAFDIPLLYGAGGAAGLLFTFFAASGPFGSLFSAASNVAAFIAARSSWLFPLTALLMSFVSFLPMAWLKHFVHYHYLPMALRAMFVAAMILVAGRALVSAASRPARRAPPRPDPAPGSLPRPSDSLQTS